MKNLVIFIIFVIFLLPCYTFSQKYPIHGKTLPLLYQSAKTWASEARSKLAELDLQEASVPEEVRNLLEKTITELRALNGKYPTDNEGQRASFDVAVILEEKRDF